VDAQEAVRLVLLYLHLIGFALLLGGFAVQYFAGRYRINAAILWGSLIQLVTGIGLAAPLRDGNEPDPAKLVVKLILALLIAGAVVPMRRRESVNRGHFLAIGAMTLLNAGVAVFWT